MLVLLRHIVEGRRVHDDGLGVRLGPAAAPARPLDPEAHLAQPVILRHRKRDLRILVVLQRAGLDEEHAPHDGGPLKEDLFLRKVLDRQHRPGEAVLRGRVLRLHVPEERMDQNIREGHHVLEVALEAVGKQSKDLERGLLDQVLIGAQLVVQIPQDAYLQRGGDVVLPQVLPQEPELFVHIVVCLLQDDERRCGPSREEADDGRAEDNGKDRAEALAAVGREDVRRGARREVGQRPVQRREVPVEGAPALHAVGLDPVLAAVVQPPRHAILADVVPPSGHEVPTEQQHDQPLHEAHEEVHKLGLDVVLQERHQALQLRDPQQAHDADDPEDAQQTGGLAAGGIVPLRDDCTNGAHPVRHHDHQVKQEPARLQVVSHNLVGRHDDVAPDADVAREEGGEHVPAPKQKGDPIHGRLQGFLLMDKGSDGDEDQVVEQEDHPRYVPREARLAGRVHDEALPATVDLEDFVLSLTVAQFGCA
mmetsp:Transcript_70232/g.184098  ORF Transcript_70232/g.184098 Transcript_70232/m.184098 type:complete len:478 (+) Transcript_70232:869-2302(+)